MRLVLGGITIGWKALSAVLTFVAAILLLMGFVVGRCTTPGGIIVN